VRELIIRNLLELITNSDFDVLIPAEYYDIQIMSNKFFKCSCQTYRCWPYKSIY